MKMVLEFGFGIDWFYSKYRWTVSLETYEKKRLEYDDVGCWTEEIEIYQY